LIKRFVSQARGRDDETGSHERRASADPDDIGGGPDERRLRRTQCLSRAQ
jgi:hypothetical protein